MPIGFLKKRLREIYDSMKKKEILGKVKFHMSTRANLVDDELCQLLKKLNVKTTGCGFESGNEEMLKYLKGGSVTVEDNRRAIRMFRKYKLPAFCSFIFGSPGESIEQMRETLDLIKYAYKNKIAFIYPFLMKPLPGTEVWDIAIQRGVVANDMNWELLGQFIENVNDQNRPLTLDPDIKIEDFKEVFEGAVKIAQKISAKRLIKRMTFHPFVTMKEIGNPIKFAIEKYKIFTSGTLKELKSDVKA